VTLSERFYREALNHPVPVSIDALALLGGSARRIDIYTWLTYRMSYLRTETTVPWNALRWQFGSNVGDSPAHIRSFRQKFEKELVRVLQVYREANVESTGAGLVLKPSPTHIGRNGRTELR
jgi:replication initiator protein